MDEFFFSFYVCPHMFLDVWLMFNDVSVRFVRCRTMLIEWTRPYIKWNSSSSVIMYKNDSDIDNGNIPSKNLQYKTQTPKMSKFLASSCSCLCAIYWSQVLNGEWRCSWSSADRWCSNYIWVINNFIAYWGASNIKDFSSSQKPLFLTYRWDY